MATLIIGLLIPLLGTMLGSAFVFFMRGEMSVRLQKSLLGFASGVMVAASVWSLLIPAMEMATPSNSQFSIFNSQFSTVLPAAVGFLLGIGFLLLIDELTPHLHIGTDKPEGVKSHLSRTAMLALAVTIHNLPEGMAVGVVFAGAENSISNITVAGALAVALGIAIQNVPEGAIISMPMRAALQVEVFPDRFPKRGRRTNRGCCRLVTGLTADARTALYACLCCRSHVLCGSRGTYPRGLQWSAF